jgi:aldose 1-epimerase
MKLSQKVFGSLPDGREVILFTITNENGYEIRTMNYGATLTGVRAPDRNGTIADITLGYDSFDRYLAGHPFFGSTVGRVCNRIGGARFTLEGTEYVLPANEGRNMLHGGSGGFHVKLWTAEPFERDGQAGVVYHLVSEDGDQGFPGELAATVSHSLTNDNEFHLEYSAETSAPTPVDLTNHAYWNLSGAPDRASDPDAARRSETGAGGAIGDHELAIHASAYLQIDAESIPTGELIQVEGTPWDFRKAKPVGRDIKAAGEYDHCFRFDSPAGEFGLGAVVHDPASGRRMEIHTTSPAVQFYTGNKLPQTMDQSGKPFKMHDALCLETQFFPNSVNRPGFPSVILRPGETWQHRTVHKFSVK